MKSIYQISIISSIIILLLLFTINERLYPNYSYTIIQLFLFLFYPMALIGIITKNIKYKYIYIYILTSIFLSHIPLYLKIIVGIKGIDIDDTLYKCVIFPACLAIISICASLILNKISCLKINFSYIFYFILSIPLIIPFIYLINYSIRDILDSDGIIAIFQSDIIEAMHFISGSIEIRKLLLVIIFAIISIIIIRKCGRCIISNNIALKKIIIIFILSMICAYHTYNNSITKPFIVAYNIIEEYNMYSKNTLERKLELDKLEPVNVNSGTFVIVIGESHSRGHMSAYGYAKETTPWLDRHLNDKNFVLLNKAFSCHVHTVPSLRYALTSKNQYNRIDFSSAYSIVEVAKYIGNFTTYWISNQFQYGVHNTPIASFASQADYRIWIQNPYWSELDTSVLKYFQGLELASNRNLIILHLSGCHYPYKNRFAFNNVINDELDNVEAYDYCVRFNDKILGKIYEDAINLKNFKMLAYVSDHGEDVDGNNHHDSAKYSEIMTEIPCWFAFDSEFLNRNDKFIELLRNKDKYFTNDLFFEALIGILGLSNPIYYNENYDIASSNYKLNKETIRTMHGEKKIFEIPKQTD